MDAIYTYILFTFYSCFFIYKNKKIKKIKKKLVINIVFGSRN